MPKPTVGIVLFSVLTALTPQVAQQGCKDVTTSMTHLNYYPIRDMRRTVALLPQRSPALMPDSLSVPLGEREPAFDRPRMVATFAVPVTPSDSSVARGERKFRRTCVPCHGMTLKGDGPVAAKFMPPPDLLNSSSRSRSDGYMYAYIRHGGAIMPSYAAQVTAQEAYELIHYIREMQRSSPR